MNTRTSAVTNADATAQTPSLEPETSRLPIPLTTDPPGSVNTLPPPGSLQLAAHVSRRRFLRRTADGIFGGLAAVAIGTMSIPQFLRSVPLLPNYPSKCEGTFNNCCTCCGPDPCCGTSCCGENCCDQPGSHSCCYCSYKGDWGGQSCWEAVIGGGGSDYFVIVCCDCSSYCGSGVCICASQSRYNAATRQWSRLNPVTSEWIPTTDPFPAGPSPVPA